MAFQVQPAVDAGYHSISTAGHRRNLNYRAIAYIAATLDFIYLVGASAAGFVAYEYIVFGTFSDSSLYIGIGLVLATIVTLAMHSSSAYRSEAFHSFGHQVRLICVLVPATLTFLLTVIFFLKIGATFSRGSIICTAAIAIGGLIGMRYLWSRYLPWALVSGSLRMRQVLLICHEDFSAEDVATKAALTGIRVLQVMHFSPDGSLPSHASDMLGAEKTMDVDEVLIVWRSPDMTRLEAHLGQLARSIMPVSVAFEGFAGEVVRGVPQTISGMVAFQTQRPPLTLFERSLKRIFDILFSLVALLTLMPMLVFVAVAIKLESSGPFLFLQSRKGYGGRAFRIFKFRSMTVLEDGGDVRQAKRGDPRVTKVGAFIRATSIDEIPQLWNILRGEMSVVGPRPHAVVHDDHYDALIAKYAYRRHMKPGLTGWAQINNCRGETPTIEKMEERIQHDLWYINNWSFWLDLKIIVMTVAKLSDYKRVY
jgi:putative colanic acid biosynthesis UDP-glucose lipid carrier transferase